LLFLFLWEKIKSSHYFYTEVIFLWINYFCCYQLHYLRL
jgi:hypothetical protein